MPASKSYVLNNVKFDGIKDGVLLDAKSGYENFVNKEKGIFHKWFTGHGALVAQADRQVKAAQGNPIEWHFEHEEVMQCVENLLNETPHNIIFKHTPI